jgi:hypothetical protein
MKRGSLFLSPMSPFAARSIRARVAVVMTATLPRLPVARGHTIVADGFATGDLTAWSGSIP